MPKKLSVQAYKDRNPSETIQFAKQILKSLGIELNETIHRPPNIKGVFSIRLDMKDLPNAGTNGKGTTLIYARASAYGEFIERLANAMLFDLGCNFVASSFCDAKKVKLNDYINTPLLAYRRNSLKFYRDFVATFNANSNDCYAVPFKQVNGKKVLWFPSVFYCVYGTNGMAAGNTYYEMSVQALSELLERYSLSTLLYHRAEVYVYDNKKVLTKFPNLEPIYNSIVKQGCTIKIYDCSLNKNLPVFAVIVFSKNHEQYSVSFGAHPNAGFAIERCFTEMFQGLDYLHFKSNIHQSVILKNINLRDLLHNGTGGYPSSFLNAKKPSKNYHLLNQHFSSNKEMYEYYLALFKKNKMPLYYHDASYLGFAAGHFIVPGLSGFLMPNQFDFDLAATRNKYWPILLNFFSLKKNQQKDLLAVTDLFFNLSQAFTNRGLKSKYSDDDAFNYMLLLTIYNAYIRDNKLANKYFDQAECCATSAKVNNKIVKQLENIIFKSKPEKLLQFFKQAHFVISEPNYEREMKYIKKLLERQRQFYAKY